MNIIHKRFVTLIAVTAMASASAAGVPGEENLACKSDSPGGDFVQFSCPLPSNGSERRWRFMAEFSGGHDDTSASMTLTLDGVPLHCDEGSKTRLFGEDGNVSLVCRFPVRGSPAAPTLAVALLWSHAQYVRTELAVDEASDK